MAESQVWVPSCAPSECIDLGDLIVRRYVIEDAPALHDAVVASTEHLRPWMPWIAREPVSVDDRRALIGQWSCSWDDRSDFTMGIFLGGDVVGGTGLHVRSDPGCLEIGYWVHVDHVGRGVATRVVRALTAAAMAMDDIDRVEIHHDVANVSSGRVAHRAGFVLADEYDREPSAPADSGRERVWITTRVR